MNESQLIERYLMRGPSCRELIVGPGDDAAVLAHEPCGDGDRPKRLVVTADSLLEGRHFSPGVAGESVGHKSLAVNLSDIAAMGASPRWATLCLSLPDDDEDEAEGWLADFSSGFFRLAARWNVALIGGDLVKGHCMATVQLIGVVEETGVLLRSGAAPGEGIYVTGDIGDAGLAWRAPKQFAALAPELRKHCAGRLERPVPRVAEGRVLSRLASAATDISDGILLDLTHLLDASGVSAQIEMERIPFGRGARSLLHERKHWSSLLTGGEDYELLFTMADEKLVEARRRFADEGLAEITRIGRVVAQERFGSRGRFECTWEGDAWPLPAGLGFDHFDR